MQWHTQVSFPGLGSKQRAAILQDIFLDTIRIHITRLFITYE